MKMVKALLLGAAAGLAGVAGAQAADLPGKAAPASYVKICDTYGAGYYYIPGSNTCLKIGGYVRVVGYTGQAYNAGTQNNVDFRSRFQLALDARSQTEYGLLRASGSFFVQRGAGNAGFVGGSSTGPGIAPDQTLVNLQTAFVQFGPLTAGYAPSFFNFYQNDVTLVESGGATPRSSDGSTNLLAFTASFGGGFMATLSVEDANFRSIGAITTYNNTTGVWTPAITNSATTGAVVYAAQAIPDVVLALRVEQGWGAVQLMGALHHVNAFDSANPAAGNFSNALQRLGYAIGAGVRLNLDQFAKGDVFWLQGVVSNGAVNYAFHQDSSDGIPQTRNSLGIGLATAAYADAAYAPNDPSGTGLATTTAWSIWGGFRHFFTPAVRASLWGGYVNVDATGGQLRDFDFWVIGANAIYSPVRDLDLSLEAGYRNLNTRTSLGAAIADTATTKATDGNWFATVRIQRNF